MLRGVQGGVLYISTLSTCVFQSSRRRSRCSTRTGMEPSPPRSWAPSWGRLARTPPRPSYKTWSTRSTLTVGSERFCLPVVPLFPLSPMLAETKCCSCHFRNRKYIFYSHEQERHYPFFNNICSLTSLAYTNTYFLWTNQLTNKKNWSSNKYYEIIQ